MQTFLAIIRRDLTLSIRRGGSIFQGLTFFFLAIVIFAFAIGPEMLARGNLASPIIWVCALLANFVALDRIFQSDLESGALDILYENSDVLAFTFLAKAAAHWVISCLPIILFTPFAALLMGLPSERYAPLLSALVIGTPALALIGTLGSALTLGLRRSNVLVAILIGPLLLPLLIFGVSAANGGAFGPSIMILAAISLFSLILAPLAGAAAMKINLS